MLRSFTRAWVTTYLPIVFITAGIFAMTPSTAQPSSGAHSSPAPNSPMRQRNTDNPEFKAEHLSKPIDVADMPLYSGKNVKFVTGTAFPKVKGGSSITMEFSTADQPKQVLEWYTATLRQYGWLPMEHMTGANGVAGMKSHNICQVMTMAPSNKGAKCDFLVRFKLYRDDASSLK